MMREFRVHGRGGQGAVMGCKVAGLAASLQGIYALSLPQYGFERRGAPVTVFLRFSDQPITDCSPVVSPDGIVVLDPKLLQLTRLITPGIKPGGIAILNTKQPPQEIDLGVPLSRVATVDATGIALDTIGRPITNTAILGAFCAVAEVIKLDSLIQALSRLMPDNNLEKNLEAVRRAHENTAIDQR
jgi:2-oxoacid:acceptor oxidoreductase gamma subunit (pyruvate/2-ketoisovalerate family)